MENLKIELQKLSQSKTQHEKQQTSARIIEILSTFIPEYTEMERNYYKLLKGACEMGMSKVEAENAVKELDQYKTYKTAKMLYELAQNALPVLNMYVKVGG